MNKFEQGHVVEEEGGGNWSCTRGLGGRADGSPSLNRPLCSHMKTSHVTWTGKMNTLPARKLRMLAMNKLVIFVLVVTRYTVEVIKRTYYLLCIRDLHNRRMGQWQHLSANDTEHIWVISTDFNCTTLMVWQSVLSVNDLLTIPKLFSKG